MDDLNRGHTEPVDMVVASGLTLAGQLELPAGEIRGRALFAHCFTCTKDLKAAVRIGRALAARGWAVLRFDFTGLGESGGVFSQTDFTSNVEDVVSAASFLDERLGGTDLLIGHSLGGAAVLAAAGRLGGLRGVATIGAPSDTEHLREILLRRAPELAEGEEAAEIELAGRRFTIRRQLLEDLAENRMEEAVRSLEVPLLLLHSPVDEVVSVDHARRIYDWARHPKSFVSLDGADHLLLQRPEDSRFVAELLAAWSSRYLPAPLDLAERSDPGPERGVVRARIGGEGYRTSLRTGVHTWLADEPTSAGGGDEGPTPYDLLLAALGACKAITLRMYADRKELPLDGVELELRHDRIHAEDCADCESAQGQVDEIRVDLALRGDLDASQRDRLAEIADRCPVHRTLSTETRIRTRLRPQDGTEPSR